MERIFLIDSFGFIFRAYYARARMGTPPMRTTTGLSTEAVYIFHNMVRKLKEKYKPEYMVAVYESMGPNFRDDLYPEYKKNRKETPADLTEQIPLVRRMLDAMAVPVVESAGFEADDVIGTLARQAEQRGMEAVIVSSDKDMLQLVSGQVRMLNPAKDDTIYDRDGVKQFMGVWPEQIIDYLTILGDSVDNIPGIPGVGEKGAAQLLEKYGTLDEIYTHLEELKPKQKSGFEQGRQQAVVSRKLAEIRCDAPVDKSWDELRLQAPQREQLAAVYREFEFFSFLRDLGVSPQATPAPSAVPEEYAPAGSSAEMSAFAKTATGSIGISFSEGEVGVAIAPGKARHLVADQAADFLASTTAKIAHDAKSLLVRWPRAQKLLRDVQLEAFLLTADSGNAQFDALCEVYLHRKPGPSAAERADLTLQLADILGPQLEAQGLKEIYDTVEMPLVPVLAGMERHGVRIEPVQLARMSQRLDQEIQSLTKSIHQHAGHEFNINSPQQLGKILFEEMGLPAPSKPGKGKSISTAADVLEGLADSHPIAAKVLEYRGLTKLKGTYVDALPELIRPETGRLHTTFQMTGAATGRLSSVNPNLQNIPVRTELGREIRAAFVPPEGWKLVVADYSQIELRLLAHMSMDDVLVESFRNGEDIHTRTAAEVFGVNPAFVTPEMRRSAKAVNFGIVYGQTSFGLASQLGIPKHEAERYIKGYFARYEGVKTFIEKTIAETKDKGFVTTLLGRRRPIPDINAKNPNLRGFAERTAVNTPLQGTAADFIKLAMIRIAAELDGQWQAKMILQVHDELVFEAPPEEVDALKKLVRNKMESVYELAVPLVVDLGVGDNWRDAK